MRIYEFRDSHTEGGVANWRGVIRRTLGTPAWYGYLAEKSAKKLHFCLFLDIKKKAFITLVRLTDDQKARFKYVSKENYII